MEELCISEEAPWKYSVPSPKVEPEESQGAVVFLFPNSSSLEAGKALPYTCEMVGELKRTHGEL